MVVRFCARRGCGRSIAWYHKYCDVHQSDPAELGAQLAQEFIDEFCNALYQALIEAQGNI